MLIKRLNRSQRRLSLWLHICIEAKTISCLTCLETLFGSSTSWMKSEWDVTFDKMLPDSFDWWSRSAQSQQAGSVRICAASRWRPAALPYSDWLGTKEHRQVEVTTAPTTFQAWMEEKQGDCGPSCTVWRRRGAMWKESCAEINVSNLRKYFIQPAFC